MPSLEDHCRSIAATISDYRAGELPAPDLGHVLRWVEQFDAPDRQVVAAEIDRALGKTYYNRTSIAAILSGIISYEPFVGNDPRTFWSNASLLEIQGVSESQHHFVSLISEGINQKYGINVVSNAPNAENWIYIDDGIFSGNQAIGDIQRWLDEHNPSGGTLNIIVIVAHTYGDYRFKQAIKPLLTARGMRLQVWRIKNLENRFTYRDQSDLLWPTQIYDGERMHYWQGLTDNDLRNFTPRSAGTVGGEELFSSVQAKLQVEEAFTRKGAEICTYSANNHELMKPLGYSPFKSYGFGTIFATYKNCPNNAPLVLWWGDPEGSPTLRRWYPLMQRRVRRQLQEFDECDF
ncbi:hypothetical protein [Terasakiella pusilla]|uniref:phosphoribosyltransferase-like protein n=1 Tax=Terasakiella pusilla TaxID=64973 RepID=UPI003AA808C1